MSRSNESMSGLHATRAEDAVRVELTRFDPASYLPLTDKSVARFLADWESFVLACLRRMRVEDLEGALYRIFHRALLALPDFRGESKISTWLYRITWREGLRSLEASKRVQQREVFFEDVSKEPGSDETALEILMRVETAERVQKALAKLRPLDREILALRYLEELKLGEVAERLDIPLGTAKVRVFRALERLKRILEEQDDE